MTHLILATHGTLAESYKQTIAMIAGHSAAESLETLCMSAEKSMAEFVEEAKAVLAKDPDGDYLILADMYGASPCNSSILAFRDAHYRVVTGLNLGMVLELLLTMENASLEELSKKAAEIGKNGIQEVYIPNC